MFKLFLSVAIAANVIVFVSTESCHKCKKNEVWSDCSNGGCDPKNCTQLGYPVPCPKIDPDCCIGGCVCADGYVRAANGNCIKKDQCPSCGGDPNAVSGCGVFCIRCTNYGSVAPPSCPGYCEKNGCECRKGFIYNGIIKKCVRPEECPPSCKINEEYSDCVNGGCEARNCSQLGFPVLCPKLDSNACIKGCVCVPGYLRDKNGKCIPKTECPSCGGDDNATSGCGTFCKQCSGERPCPDVCKKNACACKKGYIYDANIKKCVLREQCTPTCKINEEYSDCVNGACVARNCSQLGFPVPCPKLDLDACIKGCVCVAGYLRDKRGTCIPAKECPSCGGDDNATSGCGVFCNRCQGPVPCPKICKVNGCDCKDGYVYDENTKKCTLKENCTPVCKVNEVFSNCSNSGCKATNCSQLGTPIACAGPQPCVKGCVCIDGYVKADNGTCIPISECPSCGGDPNAVTGCGVFCKRCSNYKSGPVACSAICQLNGCECRDGYIYDDLTKKCVRPEQCTPICKKNEVLTGCINGRCGHTYCSDLGGPILCVDPPENGCVKGCLCADGYLRSDNGTCIPTEQCPCGGDPNAQSGCGGFCNRCSNYLNGPIACKFPCKVGGCDCREGFIYDDVTKKCVRPRDCTGICPAHEVVSECSNAYCDARNCSELGKPVPCVDIARENCIRGCVCEDGYVRDDCGKCIPKTSCPSCNDDPNAESGCGVFCTRCDNYKKGPIGCPAICVLNGCECKKGFIYDQNIRKCVRPEQCTPICKAHEVYSDCINGGCDPRNCTQLGKPVPCVKLDPAACIKGCICEPGYLRAENGTCIPKTECPSCNDDPNAISGCGTFCRNCNNYRLDRVRCPEMCMINGCECREGYIYDPNIKKCVRPEQCTPTCKIYEVYSNCTNSGCDIRNCSQLGKPVPCVTVPLDRCIEGCVCDSGYLRDANGRCVQISECPSCNDDPNAEIGCGTFCERCSNYKKNFTCPIGCIRNGCQCKSGFIYDEQIKKCVLPENCTPVCKAHEVYSDCINGGCDPRNCTQLGKPVPCVKLDPAACIKGCICEPGYLRAKNGTCIPSNECPSCNDDPNAESGCGTFCKRCSNYKKNFTCPIGCIRNGCQCKSGFIYDEQIKKCVLPKNCSPVCKPHEVYSDCINGGCDPRNCTQLGKPVPCVKLDPAACIKGCICEPGYLRAKNGTCIPSNECPSCNDDPNAESGCGTFCKRCSNYKKNFTCPIGCIRNGCQCKSGFIYDEQIKKCVLPENCTPVCKAHEVYSDCINGGCDPRNCTQLGKPVPCIKLDPAACIKGCICEPGYLRAKNGTCIPSNECPSCNDDPNAESGCGTFCKRCSNYKKNFTCPIGCIRNGCQCKSGFIYDEQIKKCVLPKNCSPVCKPHEVYSDCINGGCDPRNCTQLGKPVPCVKLDPAACIKGCICEPGYLRAKNGTCIPSNECPSCNDDPNAESGCGTFCKRCSNYKKNFTCPIGCIRNGCQCKSGFIYDEQIKKCVLPKNCSPDCGPNTYIGCKPNYCGQECNSDQQLLPPRVRCPHICIQGGCRCIRGYSYDTNAKKCVPTDQCPKTCKENEEYSTCANGICQLQNCTQYGQPVPFCPRFDTSKCKPGCICKNKFLRNDKGRCVPQEECPQAKCKKSEVYDPCANGLCRFQNCSQYGYPPLFCKAFDPKNCKGGCVCPPKYLRNCQGVCVPQEECPGVLKCKKNEVYDVCPSDCPPRTCGIDDNLVDCMPGPTAGDPKCPKPKCRCKSQFYRDDKGNCVPWDQCPKCTKPNEEYNPCFSPCQSDRCDFDPTVVKCAPPPKLGQPGCVAGCRCKDGFARNNNSICIPKDQCPCGGDPNAKPGCGGFCKRCSNYKKGPAVCPLACRLGGCDCREGYIYDDITKKCVLPKDCTTPPTEAPPCEDDDESEAK